MTPTMTRPGGRSAKVTAAVHHAVLDLLTAGEAVTIPAVAARAGVNPTSLYRRWGDVGRLLADTALARFGTSGDVPDTGSLTGDLLAWGTALVAEAAHPAELALLRAAVAAEPVDPGAPEGFESACSACLVGRSTQVEAILAAAQARGEEVPTSTRVLDHLVAPVYLRALFGLPAPSVEVLVELLVERLVAPATAQAAPSALG
ncbi:TetR-like C-terminal domain-containing protein [Kineococcus rhizosphaerae]|uniref:TetR family transcriptional regulator n=1 Tax=Kineococcus rhizosphaerae TaxID=559628 RepID=A0A2T0QTL0_9ACTN|nr:TetR-like C-terminal domain-containing protein [Kineococcus rhizosphaerae]PRY08307.1 TetR family transcriptional regulator [Kineococcus rhizosphaerae]